MTALGFFYDRDHPGGNRNNLFGWDEMATCVTELYDQWLKRPDDPVLTRQLLGTWNLYALTTYWDGDEASSYNVWARAFDPNGPNIGSWDWDYRGVAGSDLRYYSGRTPRTTHVNYEDAATPYP